MALRFEKKIAEKAKVNMLATQKNDMASAMQKSAEQIDTRQEVAKLAGVSHDSVKKVKTILEKAPKHIQDSTMHSFVGFICASQE